MKLRDALALKDVLRQGWVDRGHAHPESVAAHSWGVAFLVLMLLPDELDRERALTYAVIHDLAEAWVGDLTPRDGVPADEKHQREADAMRTHLPELYAQWQAYEAQADPEARFVKQLDRLDMALQASRYRERLDPTEFLASASQAIDDPDLRAILDRLQPGGQPS